MAAGHDPAGSMQTDLSLQTDVGLVTLRGSQ